MDSNGLNNCKLIKDFNECNNMISTEKKISIRALVKSLLCLRTLNIKAYGDIRWR
jgi:hypothetical protein